MTIKEAKREYNALLTRFNNAGEYFENDDIPYTEKEKFLPYFQKILTGLNYHLSQIEVYTNQEILGGFQDVK